MVEKPETDSDQVELEIEHILAELEKADEEVSDELTELVDGDLSETITALEYLIELYGRLEHDSTEFLPRHAASTRQTSLKVIKRDLEHIQQ